MLEDFYGTFATVSLTVTGLWMYVAQARFREWIADRDHFRRASAVSVQLAFPGLMCLFALIDPGSKLLWQVAFGVTSSVAVVLLVTLNRRSAGRWARANELGNWIATVIFALVALVAGRPGHRRGPRAPLTAQEDRVLPLLPAARGRAGGGLDHALRRGPGQAVANLSVHLVS